jgi:hypothetical protein
VGAKMVKNKVNGMTKKLQSLVKERKTPVVVTKQGSVKHKTKKPGTASVESYSYSSYNT